MDAYWALEARFRRLADIEGAIQILAWDQAVIMPPGGITARAEQQATLQMTAHELLCAPGLEETLAAAAREELGPWERANLELMARARRQAVALPPDLVGALARACAHGEMIWRRARPADDFSSFRPCLEEIVRLTRDKADALADACGLTPFDALLDQYEEGMSTTVIDALFAPLAARLPDLLDQVLAEQARRPAPITPAGPFPIAAQRALAHAMMERAGFDLARGRLDESAHPFCGGVSDDVRITTRYAEDGFVESLMAVLHETGHGLYSQGLPEIWRRQPVGQSRGMAVHESQSLIMEMQAGRSAAFLAFLGPTLEASFGPDRAFAPDNLQKFYTRVQRGLIRVEADEVTYPLHIVLRYRLEKALIAGELAIADLPAAWRAGMRDLLQVEPASDRDGCLQDIHWAVGAIGYFPCYTVGAMMAAQLFEAAKKALPELEAALAKGDFTPLVGWLRRQIHGQGQRHDAMTLIAHATGRPLDAAAFLAHLERRYVTASRD